MGLRTGDAGGGSTVELREVAVDRYKNLAQLRVEWSPRMVLYGANGTGKSNVLEAVALACGSRATMWQLSTSAVTPEPGAISLLVKATPQVLPLAPDLLPPAEMLAGRGSVDGSSPAGRLLAERRFWEVLGVERGGSWPQALWSGALDARVAGLVEQAAHEPLIRYRLEDVAGLRQAAGEDRGARIRGGAVDAVLGIDFVREFSRVLALEGSPPGWLVDMADDLPDVFAPLRAWLAQPETSRSPHAEVLALPPTDRVPVQMVWMATERSSSEAWFDLFQAVHAAAKRSFGVFDYLSDVPVWSDAGTSDGEVYREDIEARAAWWLNCQATEAARELLGGTFPELKVYVEDDVPADIYLEGEAVRLGRTHLREPGFLEQLSSGERVWMDAALAHGAAEVERLGVLNAWRSTAMGRLSQDEWLEAAVGAQQAFGHDDMVPWDAHAIDLLLGQLDRRLMGTADYLQDPLGFGNTAVVEETSPDTALFVRAAAALDPGVREIRESPKRLTAFDEPERHLHPAAQRRVARSLNGVRPDEVVVATHSHLFLGQPGWTHLHLSKTAEGTVAAEFDVAGLDRTDAITQEMGLTRGELLAFVRYVLVVEGIVDRLVLETLYGDLLGEAGVLLLPLHGINEVNSLAELTIIGELLDVGVGVLADHTRAKHLAGERLPQDATKEEQALWDLRRLLHRRGREIDLFGLKRIDVIAYIDETTFTERFPGFPGWEKIERRSRTGGTSFKKAIEDAIGQPVRFRLVKELVETMAAEGRPAPGDLPSEVQRIVSRADQVHLADDGGHSGS